MTGQWLATPEVRPKSNSQARAWLRSRVGAIALVADEAPGFKGRVGIYFGDAAFFETVRPGADFWMGELSETKSGRGRPELIHRGEQTRLEAWSKAYAELVLGKQAETPNLIYLDGEDRRWVRPKGDPGRPIGDDPAQSWLVTYRPSEDWQGQLEASLVALKALDEERYHRVLADLNAFLVGKTIRSQPTPSLRLLVDVKDEAGEHSHPLDDLSSGERQMLIQLYLVSRWLQAGGLVLLDEPDLHMHPSLVDRFIARMHEVVAAKQGQLVLTSHLPMIWDYVEARGVRIRLGQGGDL
jgi:hypothetical protein